MDNATIFIRAAMKEFAIEFGIKIVNSTLYNVQDNGQAEGTNKTIKANIQRMKGEIPIE